MSEPRPLTDAELTAVAALAQIDAMSMKSENDFRLANGLGAAYSTIVSDASVRLETELRRRGVL